MGLFGKSRAKDETDSASSDEDAPPAYAHEDSEYAAPSDSKAALLDEDDDDKDDVVVPGAVWLDAVKADKHGTSIVRREAPNDILYTFTLEKRWTNPTVHMFHGSVQQDPEQRPAHILPFASLKSSSILLRDAPDQVEATKYKTKKLIRLNKWYGMPSVFTVGDTDYRIRILYKSWTGKLILTIADDPTKTPLCMFRPAKKLFVDVRSSIEILPTVISTTTSPKPHALLHDGRPTRLLDMALIAESVVRTTLRQANNAAAASSAAASTSAVVVT